METDKYIKQEFIDQTEGNPGTVLSATHLNHIEDGIVNAFAALDTKQQMLISGDNIKTVNGISLLGSGNISLVGGEASELNSKIYNTDEVTTVELQVYADKESVAFDINGQTTIAGDSAGVYINEDISLLNDKRDAFYLCDGSGNAALKIDEEGFVIGGDAAINGTLTYKYKGTDCWMTNKSFWVIGDSLSNSKSDSSWMGTLAAATNSIWYPTLNAGGTCKGGTKTLRTYYGGEPCGQLRAKKVVEHYNNGYPVDVVFIQNVNDSSDSNMGTVDDVPWFANQVITYTNHTLENKSDALSYFQSNIDTILESVDPCVGTVILMQYVNTAVKAKKLTITKPATQAGTVQLKVGSSTYGVTVNPDMTIQDIIHAITEYDFLDYSDMIDTNNPNSVIFTDVHTGNEAKLEVNVANTGVEYQIVESDSMGVVPIAFTSKDISKWKDSTCWNLESTISMCSGYKGMIEYLLTNIPKVKIFMVLLTHIGLNYETTPYRRADGTFDMESWQNKRSSHVAFYKKLQELAEYYYLPCINVESECGINPINAYVGGFFPVSDVHPSLPGQIRWGETLSRILTTR